jgi:rhamnose transport system permease protein
MNRTALRRLGSWDVLLCALLIALFLMGNQFTENVRTAETVFSTLRNVGEIMLVALPMTMLIISGEIDLSVGSTVALSSCVIGKAFHAGQPMWVCALLGILAGAACGAFNGFLVTRVRLQSLAATIGTLALYRGLSSVLLGDQTISGFPANWVAFGYRGKVASWLPKPWLFVLVAIAVFTVVLRWTKTGHSVYAIGLNPEAARYSGIPVQRIKFTLFVVTGAMAGVAGVFLTLRQSSSSPAGAPAFELSVIAAALFGGVSIFGGKGGLFGVVNAVLFLGLSRLILQLAGVKPNVLTVVTGGLLLVSVVGPALSMRLRALRIRAPVSDVPPRPTSADQPALRDQERL